MTHGTHRQVRFKKKSALIESSCAERRIVSALLRALAYHIICLFTANHRNPRGLALHDACLLDSNRLRHMYLLHTLFSVLCTQSLPGRKLGEHITWEKEEKETAPLCKYPNTHVERN